MEARPSQFYHIVIHLPSQNKELIGMHCIPASWIRWEDKECSTVLVAYPDEPWEIIKERVRNYENPHEDWNMYLMKVIYSTDFYDKVIRCINQREHSVEESRGSQVIVSKVGSLHCSYSMESHKLDMHSNSTGSNDLVMDGMNKNLTVQSKSSASDSNNDVPCDLSISSADRRNINRRAHSIEELLCPEVIMTDVGSPQGTSTSEALRRVEEMNNTSNFQDWMFCRISSFLYAYQNSVTSPNDSDNKWTLKHKGPLPGLVELWPNSGVYIRDLELKYCLRYAKKGTQLSRFLTKHIFSELALRSCWSINDKYDRRFNLYGGRHFGLYGGAITAIVNFVQTYGKTQNWRPQSEKSIKSAVRYQLSLFKKTT